MPSHFTSCYDVFGEYSGDACSFLRENRGRVDLEESRWAKGRGELREGKLLLGYTENRITKQNKLNI